MTERDVRRLMHEKGLQDAWWFHAEGEPEASSPVSLFEIVERFEGKTPQVSILPDARKNDPEPEWLTLRFTGAPAAEATRPRPPAPPKKGPTTPPADTGHTPGDSGGEDGLWKGGPSQWVNGGLFALCALAMAAGVALLVLLWSWLTANSWALVALLVLFFLLPLGIGFWRWLETRYYGYRVTNQRLFTDFGVLNRRSDAMELYRVKDIEVDRPFWLRLIRRGNVILHTSDRTTPTLVLKAVADPMELQEKIRARVEYLRESKRVREMDFADSDGLEGL